MLGKAAGYALLRIFAMNDATPDDVATKPVTLAANEGARLLRLAGTIDHCAAETQLSTRSITSYRNGAVPNDAAAARLAAALGIPRSAWRQPPTAYRDPPWLQDALEALTAYPAATFALLRHLIVKAGDAAALAHFDANELPGDERTQALLRAAQEAERALIPAVYGDSTRA